MRHQIVPLSTVVLPETDAVVIFQMIALLVITIIALKIFWKVSEAKMLIIGLSTFIFALMMIRTIH